MSTTHNQFWVWKAATKRDFLNSRNGLLLNVTNNQVLSYKFASFFTYAKHMIIPQDHQDNPDVKIWKTPLWTSFNQITLHFLIKQMNAYFSCSGYPFQRERTLDFFKFPFYDVFGTISSFGVLKLQTCPFALQVLVYI